MSKAYLKKIDNSTFVWGFTIPQDYIKDFLGGKKLKIGTSRKVNIVWDNKNYNVEIRHIDRKAGPVYRISWMTNKAFLAKIRKTFIQSYVIIKSEKELFEKDKQGRKNFRTSMVGGQQEVISLKPVSHNKIVASVFIKIDSEWNGLFERLADANVFGWLFDKNDTEHLIQRSTNWLKVSEFKNHKDEINVIYYLANTKKKKLYIGKAEVFGKRVSPGRAHQEMDGDWDLFKYDIIRPEFAKILKRIEDHTIRTTASILSNTTKYSSLNISNYTLVNKNWKKI